MISACEVVVFDVGKTQIDQSCKNAEAKVHSLRNAPGRLGLTSAGEKGSILAGDPRAGLFAPFRAQTAYLRRTFSVLSP